MDFLPWQRMRDLVLSEGNLLFFGEPMARLSAYLMGQFAVRGKSITLVDATQTFDPYLVARVGRLLGIPSRPLLERIRLSRAFTCHQLVTVLCEILPNSGMNDPLFVLGPCALFYDEQVPLKERQALFLQVVRSLLIFKKRGTGLFSFPEPHLPKGKKSAFWAGAVPLGSMGYPGRLGGTGNRGAALSAFCPVERKQERR